MCAFIVFAKYYGLEEKPIQIYETSQMIRGDGRGYR